MGAWDYGHLDNDTALDFVDDVINKKALEKLAKKKKIDEYEYNEVRAACVVVVQLAKLEWAHFDEAIVEGLTQHLEKIYKDEKWLDNWLNPKKVKKNVGDLLKQMRNVEGY